MKRSGHERLLALWVALAVVVSSAGADAAYGAGSLQESVVRTVSAYEHSSPAVCGVFVRDMRTGRNVIDIRSQDLFVPASNQKILISAFALSRLGPEFKFTTSVYLSGRDIVVVGDGDPTIGDPRLAIQAGASIYAELDRWSQAVYQSTDGHCRNLLLHSRFNLDSFRHPDWPAKQRDKWYAAPVAGLNFHNNCFDVTFSVSGELVTPYVSPASPLIQVVSNVKKGKRHIWWLRPQADDSVVRLGGTVTRSTKEPLSVAANNPPMLLGRTLAGRLERAGVTLSGAIRQVKAGGVDLSGAKLLCSTATPLAVAMKRANNRSLNMAAECIFLRAGDGTWQGSAEIMAATLVKDFALSGEQTIIRDGGGLSRQNRATPAALGSVLAAVARKAGADVFLASLPVSGLEGSLKKRLARAPYKGRVLAKTGTVNGASCLSGYVVDDENHVALSFSILIGKVPPGKAWRGRQLQDSICRLLVDWLDRSQPG